MLRRLIRSVRRKPKAVRDQYAFWTAISFTSLIILVWVVALPDRLSNEEPAEPTVVTDSPESFSDMISGLREELETMPDVEEPQSIESLQAAITASTSDSTLPQLNNEAAVRIATFTASTTQ